MERGSTVPPRVSAWRGRRRPPALTHRPRSRAYCAKHAPRESQRRQPSPLPHFSALFWRVARHVAPPYRRTSATVAGAGGCPWRRRCRWGGPPLPHHAAIQGANAAATSMIVSPSLPRRVCATAWFGGATAAGGRRWPLRVGAAPQHGDRCSRLPRVPPATLFSSPLLPHRRFPTVRGRGARRGRRRCAPAPPPRLSVLRCAAPTPGRRPAHGRRFRRGGWYILRGPWRAVHRAPRRRVLLSTAALCTWCLPLTGCGTSVRARRWAAMDGGGRGVHPPCAPGVQFGTFSL